MNRGSLESSPSALRSSRIVLLSTASPTNTPGQTRRAIPASRPAGPPGRARNCSSANAFGASATICCAAIQVAADRIEAEIAECQDAFGRHGSRKRRSYRILTNRSPRATRFRARAAPYNYQDTFSEGLIYAIHSTRSFALPLVVAAAVLAPPVVAGAAAQTTALSAQTSTTTPRRSPAPAPGAPIAPRLQNLGAHTFPVSTKVAARAVVHEPGPEPDLWVQPRRGGPRLCRSGPARSVARDGLLGPGARARPEHQRADGRGRRAQGAGAAPEGDRAEAEATPRERAYIDALAARYTGKPEDRAAADRAYATRCNS